MVGVRNLSYLNCHDDELLKVATCPTDIALTVKISPSTWPYWKICFEVLAQVCHRESLGRGEQEEEGRKWRKKWEGRAHPTKNKKKIKIGDATKWDETKESFGRGGELKEERRKKKWGRESSPNKEELL